MAEQLSRVELLRLARLGAASRLAELRREIASLETLVGGGAPAGKSRRRKRKARASIATKAAAARKQSAAWSAAARKAVSLRMKRYWAARRQAKKR